MKKYNMINFITKERKIKNTNIISILVLGLIIFIVTNQIINQEQEIQIDSELEVFEEISDYEEINQVSSIYIDFKPIKTIYKVIGKNNIMRISYEENNLEIEGICKDLSLLQKLKSELKHTYFSINNISNNKGGYLFNLNCTIGV